jgi:glycogen debranching enzyme
MTRPPTAQIRPEIRYAWHGASQLIVDTRGECGAEPLSGFYFRETRYLSVLRLEIEGEPPFLCALGDAGPGELDFVFIHPELRRFGGGGSGLSGQEGRQGAPGVLRPRSIDLRLRYRVHPGALEAVLEIGNHSTVEIELGVAWEVGADFADLQEAHGGERLQDAAVEVLMEQNGLRFRYTHPRLPLETHVTAAGPAAWTVTGGRVATRIALRSQAIAELVLRVDAVDPLDPIAPSDAERREARLAAWCDRLARFDSPGGELLPDLTNRAMLDLGSFALLEGEEDEWLAPAAGVPLYPALFGRDALTSSWQASMLDRGQMIEASLTRLARLQGTRSDPSRDEQPGRIIQQARRGPLARLGVNPFDRYYGDFASPFVFLIALGQLYAWTGERRLVERHWDAARRILDWARDYGDADGDGFLEYRTLSPYGPVHQGWKDSGDSIVYADGRPVPTPAAVCEVQGYYYVAQQFMAVLAAVMGERATALALWRSASALKARFNRDFWMEDEGFLAVALDPDGRPVRSLASNAGQCLATGIVSDAHVPRLVERLFQPDLFSGWGIRTLSTANPAYNPLSYHRGSVWSVENGTILFGLRRYGFDQRTHELARALIDLAALFPRRQTPECVGGYTRGDFPHPGSYPRANAPQAWNQSVFPLLAQSLLGIFPVAPLDLLIVDPALPVWLPELVLRDLRVGGATVSLRFTRDADGASHVEMLEKAGTLRVVRQPSPDDLASGFRDRLGALFCDRLRL